MYPFRYSKAYDERSALSAATSGARYIAGGTTLIDLMRETVERPDALVDITALPYRDIDLQPSRLRIGALVRMSELAERRLDSYRKLQRESAWAASRTDARLRDERVKRQKAITGHLRATYRFRDQQP